MANGDHSLLQKGSFNLNTIVALVGFLGMFASFVATWTLVQERQTDTDHWQAQHEAAHIARRSEAEIVITRFNTDFATLKKELSELEQLRYRMGQNEKVFETIDDRISRITESYSNQFVQMREQLGMISTQLALANDALKRVETGRRSGIDLQNGEAIQRSLRKN